MKKLSTGGDSTLGNWLGLTRTFFGKYSAATKFLEAKAEESPEGLDQEVIADERQLIALLMELHNDGGE